MIDTWGNTTLGEFAPFRYGQSLTKAKRDGGQYPVVGSGGVNGWHSEALVEGPVVVVGRKGTVGSVQLFKEGAFPIDTTFYVTESDARDQSFTYYLLSSLGMEEMNSDSAVPGLNRDRAHAIKVRVPALEEQRRIAGVLGALDDLAETCGRLISLIDQVGRALVRRANFSEADDVALVRTGSALMGEVIEVLETGRRPKGGVKGITSGVPSIGAESINGLAVFDFGKTKFVPEEYAEQMTSGVLADRDLLVYKDGGKPGDFRPKVGMFGLGFPFERMVINEHVFRVRAKRPLTESYLYFWLQQPELLDSMRQAGTGAAVPGLNRTAFKSLPVGLPKSAALESLLPTLETLSEAALMLAVEGEDARRTRDELLPLLLSGRVRVGEVAA